jgi:hypothetical protein
LCTDLCTGAVRCMLFAACLAGPVGLAPSPRQPFVNLAYALRASYRVARSMNVIGGHVPARASPVTSKP